VRVEVGNFFFNGVSAPCSASVYAMPSNGFLRPSYSFAEYEAARNGINQAFAQADWDGYGAAPIRDETKQNALGILGYLETATRAPEITPNPNGTLSLEWETGHGFGQLEIGRTRYSFYVQAKNGSPFFDEGDVNDVKPTVGWLLESYLYPRTSQPVTAR
jgi:hypothetical protein